MFGVRFTLGLFGVLIGPLVVRSALGHEPYPAVLLPDGATRIAVANGVARFEVLAIHGRREQGATVRLDPREFMDPIPAHYLGPLANRGFGMMTPGVGRDEAWQWVAARVLSRVPDAVAFEVVLQATSCVRDSNQCRAERVGGYTIPLR